MGALRSRSRRQMFYARVIAGLVYKRGDRIKKNFTYNTTILINIITIFPTNFVKRYLPTLTNPFFWNKNDLIECHRCKEVYNRSSWGNYTEIYFLLLHLYDILVVCVWSYKICRLSSLIISCGFFASMVLIYKDCHKLVKKIKLI